MKKLSAMTESLEDASNPGSFSRRSRFHAERADRFWMKRTGLFLRCGWPAWRLRTGLLSLLFGLFVISTSPASAEPWGAAAPEAATLDRPAWAQLQSTAAESPLWKDFDFHENGWAYDEWLGWIYPTAEGWVLHLDFGWFMPASDSLTSFWIYDVRLGFLWTSKSRFPAVYDPLTAHWLLWLRGTSSPRWFYDWQRNGGVGGWANDNDVREIVSRDPVEFRELEAGTGDFLYRSFVVPSGVPFVRVSLTAEAGEGGHGDADLFLNTGSTIDSQNFTYASMNIGSGESLLIEYPAPGPYAIMIEAMSAFQNGVLQITYPETVSRNFAPESLGGRSLALFLLEVSPSPGQLSRYFFFDVQSAGDITLEDWGPVVAPEPESFTYSKTSGWTANSRIEFSSSKSAHAGQFEGSVALSFTYLSETSGTVTGVVEVTASEIGTTPAGSYEFSGTFQLY